jgi:hypothetical protein
MGLLIQPVIGDEYDGRFMPALSGVLTTVNGQPLMRLVVGLGTGAVDMGEAVVLKGKAINSEKAIKSLSTLKSADTINLNTGQLESTPINKQIVEALTAGQRGKLDALLQEWQKEYDSGAPFYLEFAIAKSQEKPVILQASPDEIKPAIAELGMPKGIVLCEGTDVVNTGEKYGRGIVWFGESGQDTDDLVRIAEFNRNNHNFLLLVRDTAFSSIYGQPLIEIQHFSNAAGVVEVQYQRDDEIKMPGILNFTIDHTNSRGGAHFAEICKRKDILFLGYTVSRTADNLRQVLGQPTDKFGSFSAYWDVDFLMSNALSGGRVELMGEVVKSEFSPGEIRGWADEFWHLAGELGDGKNGSLSAAFYYVCYLFGDLSEGSVVDYNPFDVSKLPTNRKEITGRVADIKQVLKNIHLTESAIEYDMYKDVENEETGEESKFRLKSYLEKLLNILLAL